MPSVGLMMALSPDHPSQLLLHLGPSVLEGPAIGCKGSGAVNPHGLIGSAGSVVPGIMGPLRGSIFQQKMQQLNAATGSMTGRNCSGLCNRQIRHKLVESWVVVGRR